MAERKPSAGIYLSAELDDAGLDSLAFRVYGRIVRRCNGKPKVAGCFETLPHMAEALRADKRSVRDALAILLEIGAIGRNVRPGRTTEWGFFPIADWVDNVEEAYRQKKLQRVLAKTEPEPTKKRNARTRS